MFTSTAFPPAVLRASFAFFALLQKFLMVVGLVFLTALVGLQAGHSGLIDGLKTLVSSPRGHRCGRGRQRVRGAHRAIGACAEPKDARRS